MKRPAGTSKTANSHRTGKKDEPPSVDEIIQSKIGQKLRDTYVQVVREPIPDRFHNLLRDLRARKCEPGGDKESDDQ